MSRGDMDINDVARIMSMKPDSIAAVHQVADGTLVVTREGAQTLILADGSTRPVLPRRALPVVEDVEEPASEPPAEEPIRVEAKRSRKSAKS